MLHRRLTVGQEIENTVVSQRCLHISGNDGVFDCKATCVAEAVDRCVQHIVSSEVFEDPRNFFTKSFLAGAGQSPQNIRKTNDPHEKTFADSGAAVGEI